MFCSLCLQTVFTNTLHYKPSGKPVNNINRNNTKRSTASETILADVENVLKLCLNSSIVLVTHLTQVSGILSGVLAYPHKFMYATAAVHASSSEVLFRHM